MARNSDFTEFISEKLSRKVGFNFKKIFLIVMIRIEVFLYAFYLFIVKRLSTENRQLNRGKHDFTRRFYKLKTRMYRPTSPYPFKF